MTPWSALGDGPVKVNGKALDEPYVFPGNTPCSNDGRGTFKVTVPQGRLWVMGDHRQASADSRYHRDDRNDGMVPEDEVVGRAVVVAWPVGRWSTLPVPAAFSTAAGAALLPGPAAAVAAAVPLVLLRRRRATSGADAHP